VSAAPQAVGERRRAGDPGGPRVAARRRMRRRAGARGGVELALELTVPLLLLGMWELVTTQLVTSFYFPPLHTILKTFWDTWVFDHTRSDLVPSLVRLLVGYGIAVVAGVGIGVLLGLSRRAQKAVEPIVEFLRAIPPPALLPFAIVVIGVGDGMKVFIIAFVSVWPILLNATDGITGVDQGLLDSAKAFGIRGRDRFRRVLLPSAAPQIFAGMRTSLAVALILMVISEMVASTSGIGYFVLNSERTFAIPEMWSGIIVLGILGYVLNLLFLLVERRVLRWHRGLTAATRS
jgi:ABC-type nitrate/sulfonate/bicarbonate transport system permease component